MDLPASGLSSLHLSYKLPSDKSPQSKAFAFSAPCSEIFSGSRHTLTTGHSVGLRFFFTLLQPTFQTGLFFPFLHSALQPDALSITPKFSFHSPASISLSLWPFSQYSLFLIFYFFPASLLKVQLRCRVFMKVFIIPFWAASHLSSL